MFKHCDPAGIVFYPRYFEIMNDCVENFFDQELLCPFAKLHETHAVPTASVSTQFKAPSRHGEKLSISLEVTKLGRTSMDLFIQGTCDNALRFESRSTLVSVNKSGRPTLWPNDIRSRIQHFMKGQI